MKRIGYPAWFVAWLLSLATACAWAAGPEAHGAPLTASPGDPARGRAIVVDRYKGLCLLCHPGPFPEQAHQGQIAPDLGDVGRRLTESQLRQRIVDSRSLNPQTLMPSYHRTDGLERVATAFRGKPIFTAQEVEDVVAFLLTLRGSPAAGAKP
jgi:sulfur-oxidizing protein SoxX